VKGIELECLKDNYLSWLRKCGILMNEFEIRLQFGEQNTFGDLGGQMRFSREAPLLINLTPPGFLYLNNREP
jgi:hypothetical protein